MAPLLLLVFVTPGNCASAASSRSRRSWAARFCAAARREPLSVSAVTAARCARASWRRASSVVPLRKEHAPALARTRVPSCATRMRSTRSWLMSKASTCVIRSSNTSALWLRKSLSVWWLSLHPAAQPPIGGVQLGQALDLPSAVLAVAGGVHPQAEQELGVDGRRSGVRVACIDASVELREVQAVDHRSDGTHGVVVRYLRVQIDAPPAELLTMGLSKSGAAFRI